MIRVSHSPGTVKLHCDSKTGSRVVNTLESSAIVPNVVSVSGQYIISVPDTITKKLNEVLFNFRKEIKPDESYKKWKMTRTPISIRCGCIKSKIETKLPPNIESKIKAKLSYFVKAAVNTQSYKTGRWDGTISLYDGRGKTYLTGLTDMVIEILNDCGYEVKVVDDYDTDPPRQFDWEPTNLFTIAEDQEEAIEKCLKAKRCVCKAPTGYGKTAVLARYLIANRGVPTLFVANKKQLLDDAAEDFVKGITGITSDDIGQIKDGIFCSNNLNKKNSLGQIKPITQPIVVATIQSLAARLKDPMTRDVLLDWLHNTCKFVMVDETQAVGSTTWDEVLSEIYAPYRVFLSATPKRTDGATIKIYAYSGPLAFTTTAESQIEKGRLCELDINYVCFDHKMHNEDDKDLEYNNLYETAIMQNEERNMKCVIEPTFEMLKEGRFVLVLIQRIDHGLILKDLFIKQGLDPDDIRFVWGETAEQARKMAISEFRKGEFKVLIGSTIFDAGVNIPLISGVVLAGAGNSEITLIQRIGRGARTCDYEKAIGYLPDFMKKESGKVTKVYDVIDSHIKFFTKQSKNRYNIAKEEFGESRIHIVGGDKSAFRKYRPEKDVTLNEREENLADLVNAANENLLNIFK